MLSNRVWLVFFILLSGVSPGRCQVSGDTIRLSLGEVVVMAKERSIASRQAATVKETKYYWGWKKRNYWKDPLKIACIRSCSR